MEKRSVVDLSRAELESLKDSLGKMGEKGQYDAAIKEINAEIERRDKNKVSR